MKIDNDQGQNHFLESDLINGAQTLTKCAGGSTVGTFIVPVNRLARPIWESWPARDARLKCMSKIDTSGSGQGSLNFPERWLLFRSREWNERCKREQACHRAGAFKDLHSDLLNQRTARSQQVRITLKRLRLPQGNRDLSALDADTTNTSSIER
jgi:hypothetical protein